jgi:hypothetical protein
VYLDDSGACANGHGPECVSAAYEVAEQPTAPPAPADAPAYAPAPAFVPAPVTAVPARKRRGGLVIAIVVIVLLLICGCGIGGFFLFSSSSSKSTDSAPAKTRDSKGEITAAFGFLKGMGAGDIELFKSVMPEESVKAVPKETWDSLMADAAADPTQFGTLEFAGDKANVTFAGGDGSKGTMDFRTAGTDLVVVTLKPSESESEDATLTMSLEKDRWTVTAFETVDGVLQFDPESIKGLAQ